MFELHTPKQQN